MGRFYSFLLWDINNFKIDDSSVIKVPEHCLPDLEEGKSAYWMTQKYNNGTEDPIYRIIKTPIKSTFAVLNRKDQTKIDSNYDEENWFLILGEEVNSDDLEICFNFLTSVRFDIDTLEYYESFDYIVLQKLRLKRSNNVDSSRDCAFGCSTRNQGNITY